MHQLQEYLSWNNYLKLLMQEEDATWGRVQSQLSATCPFEVDHFLENHLL